MEQLSLYRSAEITEPALVSFIGAGGKTTLMLKLANELAATGQKIIITTTTKIYPPPNLPLLLVSSYNPDFTKLAETLQAHNLVVIGSEISTDGKLLGLDTAIVERIFSEMKVFTLVEADGARGKPLKGYSDHEPKIPSTSSLVFAVTGADALGKKVSEATIHRVKEFCASAGINMEAETDCSVLAQSYNQMERIAFNQAPKAAVQAILNKTDLLANPGKTALLLKDLITGESRSIKKIMLTEAAASNPVKILINTALAESPVTVAAILMAAGSSKRMGEDKLNLRLGAGTVFETTLQAITKADLMQVIVVTKPGSSLGKLALKYNCRVVENHHPEQGLSSSLKTGLKALDSTIQGALFALADQPLVSTELYNLLINAYRNQLKLVTCPLYRGKRGNPTIFDRRTWPLLDQIEGDQGGRSLLDHLTAEEVDYIEAEDPAVITDLDTPADYARLREHNN